MNFLLAIIYWGALTVGLFLVGGTFLSALSRHPHWLIRGWDFPRVQIMVLLVLSGSAFALAANTPWYEWSFVGMVALCTLWQGYMIFPYTPFAHREVKSVEAAEGDATVSLVTTNVQQENDQYERWLRVVRAADPDLIFALEVDERWCERLSVLEEAYPYTVLQPQDNCYGMALYSRLKLIDPKVRFIVDDEVPSMHMRAELRNGRSIWLHVVHPRPPEPMRGTDAAQRDAEVVVIAREIGEREDAPAIVGGDFNDVAWSHTTKLFLHLSHMLDPRKGRGLFNSFNANWPLFRWPLDHVFHTNHFKLVDLRLLAHVGSDHFPVYISLSHEPTAEAKQPEPEAALHEQGEAEEKIEVAEAREGQIDRDPV